MPRKPRIHFPGAVYHVMLRGNAGQDIILDEADRSRFYFLLQEGTEKFGHRIHAFCLMSNHLHLLIQVHDSPLSRIMQNVGFRYTQYYNRKKNQTGHVFQGRYKALLIDADCYLLELVRYIHLNPVRAGMVETPNDYSGSSHKAYLGQQTIPWLTTDWVYGQFAESSKVAIGRYNSFVADGLHEGHRKEFHTGSFEGRALGDDDFIESALTQAKETVTQHHSLESVVESVCTFYGLTLVEIASRSRGQQVSEARAVAALIVRETEKLSLAGLGKYLNHDLSSLSQAARRLELRIKEDSGLKKKVAMVRAHIPICQA